mgnify:CR=1 FL=1
MDALEVIKTAEKHGGMPRREALEHLAISARKLGYDIRIGGGQAGGFNIRYGSIGFAVVDVDTQGIIKLYVQPHPNKEAPEVLREKLNAFVGASETLEPKSFPINNYGHLEDKIEEVSFDAIEAYMETARDLIIQTYYEPYYE